LKQFAFSREPTIYIAIGNAILILAISFGLPISVDQKASISAVLVVVAGLLVRSQVTPTASVVASVQDGSVVVADPPPQIDPPVA
jgi:hypothetical protein